ncbi:fructosamine kinase family protein [Ferrimonas balearica]|uniref:fructosamine kinase family protein n=1 Tax=Ferrimonas balearica TaxID=44012 RepID=UPI001C98E791|nr:fructosamine kinase family protein [Ferrimonas balearica]MBY5920481.1 fructosamine kinase family protein [Ferrimonas balearica]MBY5996834.1 fructosamine kinase family protein [Ferrimonas balearica]
MWNGISQQVSDALGRDFKIVEKRRVSGGDIHQAFAIDDGHTRLFVKINDKHQLPLFEQEALALNRLAQGKEIRVPEVVHVGTTGEHAFLVLEYLELESATASQWFVFGQQLARMHRSQTQAEYGFDEDNFIGTTEQPNRWQRNWARFFAEQRIGWQLKLAEEKGFQLGDLNRWVDACATALQGHQPTASLLHGDLWRGNLGFYEGEPVLFDPASYYGDRETDLAMSELFSRFPGDFYKGYDAEWPLDPGYNQRRPIYQLYHLLNHLNLFGGSYLQQCQQQLREQFCDN